MNLAEEKLEPPAAFDFPFTPYDIQGNFMQTLYRVIENKQLGIFESPTGTGKSLSILCGAIKWIKDHNKSVRSTLVRKIEKLQLEKEKWAVDNTDWLSSQSKEIEITRQLHQLKLEQDKIIEYDKKIEKLSESKKLKNLKTGKKYTTENIEENAVQKVKDDSNDEDILIEDFNVDEDSLSDNGDVDNKYCPTKIFICSRTHSQLSQFVGEIIKSPFGKNIRVASLASRQNYCINPAVSNLKNITLINERCLDMQKNANHKTKTDSDGKVTKKTKGGSCKCPYYKQEPIEELRDWALAEVQDVEDLVHSGKELKACPYYASRKAVEDAEVVLIPYNTILHKATRDANGICLKNNVIIIDEAHNLLEALAQMHGSDLHHNQVYHATYQLKSYKHKFSTRFSAKNLLFINQLIFVVSKLQKLLEKNTESLTEIKTEIFTIENFVLSAEIDNYNMFKLVKFCKESRIAQKIRGFAMKYPVENTASKPVKKGIKDFLSSIENKTKQPKISTEVVLTADKKPFSQIPSNPLLGVISFLQSLTYTYEDGRILITKSKDLQQCKLQFLLLNPSSHFSDVVNEARSVIVAGGTMKPNAEFKDRLFIGAGATPDRIVEFSCDHIIPPENILPIIVTKGQNQESLLFNFENRMSMGNNIKCIIQQACKKVKGGIVVFFPSYKYENSIWQQIKELSFGRPVFREPQDSGSVDTVLQKYANAIKRENSSGALLFSVVGGKLSEGLNFSDDLGRCVIVVGLPYANIMAADLKEKMTYLDKTEGCGAGQKFYEGLCMKSVNQCIGRAVRHKNDYATVLLLDERYNRVTTKNALPGWIKRSLKVCNFQECFQLIDKFFEARPR